MQIRHFPAAPFSLHRITLADISLAGVVHWIRNEYKNGRRREKAIQVVNASKRVIATEITAAYGGTPTDVD
jgi:hypothetical protein